MQIVIGPILMREGGYAFDAWSPEEGFQRGYTYHRIEDAHYARKFEIRCRREGRPDGMLACNTVDEFVRSTVEPISNPRVTSGLALAMPLLPATSPVN